MPGMLGPGFLTKSETQNREDNMSIRQIKTNPQTDKDIAAINILNEAMAAELDVCDTILDMYERTVMERFKAQECNHD